MRPDLLDAYWVCECCDYVVFSLDCPQDCSECNAPGEAFESAVDLEAQPFCEVVGVV